MALRVLENATRRAVSRLPQPESQMPANPDTPVDQGTGFNFRQPQGPRIPQRDPQIPSGGSGPMLPPPRTPPFNGNTGINGGASPTQNAVQFAGNRRDDTYINSMIGQWANLPGADPSLRSDPGYWNRRIQETGGLGPDNEAYWQDMGLNNYKRPPHGQQQGGGMGNLGFILQLLASRLGQQPQGMGGMSGMGQTPMPSVQAPQIDINAIVQQALRGY